MREYLERWVLRHPQYGYAEVLAWENGEDVSVRGGRGEGWSGSGRDDVVDELLPRYVAEGWSVIEHDDAGGEAEWPPY